LSSAADAAVATFQDARAPVKDFPRLAARASPLDRPFAALANRVGRAGKKMCLIEPISKYS
jgi:hypothetical protein